MKTIKISISLLLTIFVFGILAWFSNQPQNAGKDVPNGKLMSLSFAPYREGFSPLAMKFPLYSHIDEDLALLANITHSIRTYSVLGGMQPTPDLVRKHGLKMTMGAWLGDGQDYNSQEISALIISANANPDVVKKVIVGNEVMLRKDMDIEKLIGYIREVKQAIKQPVSYADVWSSYMKHPELFKEVDFITIHILPYWEDEPVAVEDAIGHIEKIVKIVTDKAAELGINKPIFIGETGWPGDGRQRGLAVPSRINASKFIRGMIQTASRHHYDYNIVEAFNQSWKSNHEGVVGANWGLFSVDRKLHIPVIEK